jgi:uncharacterized protein (DUF2062 family)
VGTYIAFSPFIGAHTIMVFAFSWLFKLNIPVTFAASAGINNPLTAIPVYLSDYFFGYWFLYKKLQLTQLHNPAWMNIFEGFCINKLGINAPCIWSFLIGGNLLGIIIAMIAYPASKYLFSSMITRKVGVGT